MLETIGWLGGIMLAICGLPQAIKSFREKNSHGISWIFLYLWFFGELLTLVYVVPKGYLPILVNIIANIIFISIIFYYKYFPKIKDKNDAFTYQSYDAGNVTVIYENGEGKITWESKESERIKKISKILNMIWLLN